MPEADKSEKGELGSTAGGLPESNPETELLQLLRSKQTALKNVKRLAARLVSQREKLRQVNERLSRQNEALRQAELRLRQQEAEARRLALIAARTDDAVILTDAAGRVVWVNEGFVRLTGYTLDEVRGRKPGSVLQGPDTDPGTVARIREQLAKEEGVSVEIVNYTKDGRKIWLAIELQPIRDEAGQVTNYMAIERNITGRKLTDRRLAIQYEVSRHLAVADRLSSVLPQVIQSISGNLAWPVGAVWELDGDKPCLRNRDVWFAAGPPGPEFEARLRVLTFPPGTGQLGRVWADGDCVWLRDVGAVEGDAAAGVAARAGLHASVAFPVSAGGEFWGVLQFWSPRVEDPDDDLILTFASVSNQLGQFIVRRRAEEAVRSAKEAAEAANRAKGDFLAVMSHEMRTPMNAVLGMTSLLLDTRLEPRQREFVEAVRRSGEGLLEIINDILDFSKIESSRLTFEEEDFDLGVLVDGVSELLASRAQARGLEYAAVIDPDVPLNLRGDDGRLRQILVNLIGNGIKFTEQGEVVLRVHRCGPMQERVRLHFAVRDTGVGIPVGQQGRLFTPFTQVDPTSARKHGGTGLGLAISKRLVELMGGRIGVESAPGQGSTFWFELELALGRPASNVSPDGSLAGVRVLLAERHPATREAIATMLARVRVPCTAVETAAEVILCLQEAARLGQPYRLLFVDQDLPDRPGPELARALAEDPRYSGLRQVLLTRAAAWLSLPPTAGIDAQILKPIKHAQLRHCLASLGTDGGTGDRMPIEDALVGETEIFRNRAPLRREPARALRILVAEDHDINRRLTMFMLEKLGYRADFVSDGREAIESWKRFAYDVILMDCQMPVVDGYEATRAIRREETQVASAFRARVHIIAMTANAMQGDREKCLAAGMDGYISKPIRIEALQSALDQLAQASPVDPAPAAAPAGAADDLEGTVAMLEREFGAAAAVELLTAFLRDTPGRLAELRELAHRPDSASLKRAAHSLAGSCGIFGLMRMRQLALDLEQAADTAGGAPYEAQIARLEQTFGGLHPELDRVLARITAGSG